MGNGRSIRYICALFVFHGWYSILELVQPGCNCPRGELQDPSLKNAMEKFLTVILSLSRLNVTYVYNYKLSDKLCMQNLNILPESTG